MKKFLAATLAGAMVASMVVSASAALAETEKVSGVWTAGMEYSSDDNEFKWTDSMVGYGGTMYYQFITTGDNGYAQNPTAGEVVTVGTPVEKYDAVKGTSIKQKWEMGQTHVNKIEIVKKKYGNSSTDYAYFIAVSTKSATTYAKNDIVGTVTLKKSGTDGFTDIDLPVNFTVGYSNAASENVISDGYRLFEKGNGFAGDTEERFEFSKADMNYFDVDTTGQGKFIAKATVTYNNDVANKYPNANLDFFNGYDLTFNKIGTLTIAADQGSYLYQVKDGKLSAVKATYDEYEEAFKIKTRTVGNYVIADRELDVSTTSSSVEPSTAPSTSTSTSGTPSTPKPNPGTGANC